MSAIRDMLDKYSEGARRARAERMERLAERLDATPVVRITLPQVRRLLAIARSHGWAEVEVVELLNRWAYGDARHVERIDYDRICDALAHKPTLVDVRAKVAERRDRAEAATRLRDANGAAVRQILERPASAEEDAPEPAEDEAPEEAPDPSDYDICPHCEGGRIVSVWAGTRDCGYCRGTGQLPPAQ